MSLGVFFVPLAFRRQKQFLRYAAETDGWDWDQFGSMDGFDIDFCPGKASVNNVVVIIQAKEKKGST